MQKEKSMKSTKRRPWLLEFLCPDLSNFTGHCLIFHYKLFLFPNFVHVSPKVLRLETNADRVGLIVIVACRQSRLWLPR